MKWRLGKKDTEEQREGRRIIFLRRGAVVGIVTALAAVGIFCAVLFPASTAVSTTERQLPIYSVETSDKRCAISFDAAWGMLKCGKPISAYRTFVIYGIAKIEERDFICICICCLTSVA